MLTKTKKHKVIKEVAIHETDTGSAAVQIGLITKRIEELASHLKKHKKDQHSRRGLLQLVADRQKHMKYLQKKDVKGYETLLKKLELKKKAA
jgi:small subunit ribosomal protein S15